MAAFACGADDEKRGARSEDGGAGGEAASAGEPSGGSAGAALAIGGEATVTAGAGQAGGAPNSGDAGSGGQDDSGNAGQAGAGTEPQPAMPVVLVPYPMIYGARTIAVDDEYVYFPASWVGPSPPTPLPPASGSYILRVPKAGGEVAAVFQATTNGLTDSLIAVDETSVYTAYAIDVFSDKVIKLPKAELTAPGDDIEIAQSPRGGATTYALTSDSQRVYFGVGSGGIRSVPLNGGPLGTVVDETGTPPVELGHFPNPNGGLMSDGTNLYYSGNVDGIFQVPVEGGQLVLLQAAFVDTVQVANQNSFPTVHGGFVYWSYYGAIYKKPISGGSLSTVFMPPTRSATRADLAIDDQYIYSLHDGGLWKTSLDGQTRVLMAADANYERLVIDDSSVYLTAGAGQAIIKVPKSYVQP